MISRASQISLLYGCVAIFACLAIGFPTFFAGCHDGSGGCSNIKPVTITIVGYKTKPVNCDNKDHSKSCYQSYAMGEYGMANATCALKYGDPKRKESAAKRSTKKHYKLRHEYDVYHQKGTNSCESKQDLLILWIIGIVFLSFAGCFLLCLPCSCCDVPDNTNIKISPNGTNSTNHPGPSELELPARGVQDLLPNLGLDRMSLESIL
jgi:hypothetical protein